MHINITPKGKESGYAMPPEKTFDPCNEDDIAAMSWLAYLKLRGLAEIEFDDEEEKTIFVSITEHVKSVICKIATDKVRALKKIHE